MMKLDLTIENIKIMKNKAIVIMDLMAEIKEYAKTKNISISEQEYDSILKRILWD